MSVIKNYCYNAFYQLFKVIVPFITIPYLSRVLGPKGIGINSYTNSIIQYFILIGDLGINIYGNRKIAYVRNNRYKLTQTFYEIMIMQFCTLAISYLAFFIFLIFTHQYRPFYLAQSILIMAWALDISWFFMGMENFKVTVLRNCIVKILIIICIFIFVKSYSDLLLYIILYGLSFLLGNATLYVSLYHYIDLPNFKDLHVWQHLKPSIILFIPTVATQIYVVLNKTMLGTLRGTNNAGFYDQSDKVIKVILAIVTATGTVMLPHVSHAFANGEKQMTKKYLCDTFTFITSLSIAMALGLAAIAPSFVPMFFGKGFMIVIPLIMIESLIIILVGWSNAIGFQYLVPTNQTKQFTESIIFGSIVNIVVNIPLIIFFGVIGSIISTVISELSVTSYQLFSIRHQISFKNLFNDWYKYLLSGIIMFSIILFMNINLPMSWVMIVLEIFTGMVIYLFLIFIMNTEISKYSIKIIKKYV